MNQEEQSQQLTGQVSLFGDLSNKATIFRWERSVMVDVVKENELTAIVRYGTDLDGKPVEFKINKRKSNFKKLTPDEASAIVQEALAFANQNNAEH